MPGEFSWDDEHPDPTDGLDTALSPEEQRMVVSPKPRPTLPRAQVSAKVEQFVQAQEQEEEVEQELSEVEQRLAKAQCYKAILGSQLLEGDDDASLEVEEELQEWARERLEELMGLRTPSAKESPFTEQEVEVLKAVAGRIMQPKTAAASPNVKAVASSPQPIVAVKPSASSAPTVKPVQAQGKRGRGRPRKSPCQKCGGMVCSCAKERPTQTKQAPVQAGEQIEFLPDGTKIKKVGHKVYKLVPQEVRYKDGTTGVEEIPIDITPTPKLQAVPYPSEAEVMARAAVEAQQSMSRLGNVKGLKDVVPKTITVGD